MFDVNKLPDFEVVENIAKVARQAKRDYHISINDFIWSLQDLGYRIEWHFDKCGTEKQYMIHRSVNFTDVDVDCRLVIEVFK